MANFTRRQALAIGSGLVAFMNLPVGGASAAVGDIDDPQSFSHYFASVNGVRMHYVEEGQGPLVLLLHGYPFLWYLWRHQMKAVAAAGYRVVAPDQRRPQHGAGRDQRTAVCGRAQQLEQIVPTGHAPRHLNGVRPPLGSAGRGELPGPGAR